MMRLSLIISVLFHLCLICKTKGDFKDSNFKDDFLKAHNVYRKKHGAGELEYDPKANKLAQDWAETLARTDRIQHSFRENYGENLYMTYNSDPKAQVKGQDPVFNWYSEVKNYDFNSGQSMGGIIGHFTQVVWSYSKKIGVGVAKSKSNKVYIVANYSPPGNVQGQYKENVHKEILSSDNLLSKI